MEHKNFFFDGYHNYCPEGIDPEAVVISGISGRFPESDNVGEYKEAVYSKRSLIHFTDERFQKGSFKNPYASCGIIKNIDKLDTEFFCLSHAMSNVIDPGTRIHQEVVYECIFDAGYNPGELKGANIGVYNGTTADDAMILHRSEGVESSKFPLYYNIRTMRPNRASFVLDFKGPSHTIDSACSSSAIALHSALNDMKHNLVDAAVVSGIQLNLDPEKTSNYINSGIASLAGNSIPYDAETDGMLRTEAISAVFLQKAKHARRVYAVVLNTCYQTAGYVPEGISVPSAKMQNYLINRLLKESGIHPNQIHYVEGHGTGTPVGDPIEVNALENLFFAKDVGRKKPLYLGSSKSNIGHTEATAGILGVLNGIMAFETGLIPPNIRYKTPNPHSPALADGKIIVPSSPIPLESPYIPVSSFGFGGTAVVIALKQCPVTKEKLPQKKTPRIVLYAATTDEAVSYAFDRVKSYENDPGDAFYTMLNKLAYTPPVEKPFRGYSVFYDYRNFVSQIQAVSGEKRQVWFVMTGMGCQWAGMGLQLMSIEVFAASMRRSAQVLKGVGIDLFELLRADKNYMSIDRRIIPAFVCISSVQIALLDLLKHVGIEPDFMIGHSTGEILCAYADGCCTAEEAIMIAYYKGVSVEAGSLQRGSMAAVGLSWEEAQRRCPEGIYPACDNSDDSVTISGLEDEVRKFVEELKRENVFARVVNTYGYAFHSKYVHSIDDTFRSHLKKLIKHPKKRSSRWLSTSHPEEELEASKMADVEYFANNFNRPVLFRSAMKKIPPNAVTIEIGPHHLLQSVLKRGCGPETSHVGLMKMKHEDGVMFLLEALGKLYNEGLDPKVEKLYPPVNFPVPRGSPVLSDLIKWNHSMSFFVPKYVQRTGPLSTNIRPDKKDFYLLDHRIDGRSLFPATGYIWLVWEVLALRAKKEIEETPIIIENLKIHRATVLNPQTTVKMITAVLDATGFFEIKEGNQLVASGFVRQDRDLVFEENPPSYTREINSVAGEDLYNELKMGGYEYGPHFQSIVEINMNGTSGLLSWKKKWIPFLDSMLLFFGLIENSEKFVLPTGIGMIKIDPVMFHNFIRKRRDETDDPKVETPIDTVPVSFNPDLNICRSVGIEIKDIEVDQVSLRESIDKPTTEEYKFIPYSATFNPDDKKQVEVFEYMGMCNKVIHNLQSDTDLSKFPDYPISPDKEEFFRITEGDDRVLLNLLMDLSSDLNETKIKKNLFEDIGKDITNSVLVDGDLLRSMMELIMENSFEKLSVLELNRDFPLVLPIISNIFSQNAHLKLKRSTLIVKSTEDVDRELMAKHNIKLLDGLGSIKKEDIVVSSFISGSTSDLQTLMASLTSILSEKGFILLFFKDRLSPGERTLSSLCESHLQVLSHEDLAKVLRKEGLVILSQVTDALCGGALYLIRTKFVPEQKDEVIIVKEDSFSWVEEVKDHLYGKHQGGRLWLVSQDSPTSGIVGMVNCLKQEPNGNRIRCVFISQNAIETKLPTFDLKSTTYKSLSEKNLLMNVWKDGAWGSYRHVFIKEHKLPRIRENSYVYLYKTGDFSSLKWTESASKFNTGSKEKIRVEVYYSAINFKDVMLSSGKIALPCEKSRDNSVKDCQIGFEFSGRDATTGRRVMGFSDGSAICTTYMAPPPHLIDVPDHWSLEEAATVTVVYTTVYYALVDRAKIQKGESVLIHSGTGGVGTAAIRVALSFECEVFTTVGTEEKKQYLMKLFPQIKEENIGNSRDISFEKMIKERTNGKGVDIVLNSLADEKLQASLRCVSRFGRFMEIGKYDLLKDTKIGLKWFVEGRQFNGIALEKMFEPEPESKELMNRLTHLLKDGIRKGVVQPLDRTVFERDQVEEAFRYMGKGAHTGKILIKIREEEKDRKAIPHPLPLAVIPKTFFYDSKVYIIIGGLGGFGIELTKWMVKRGARKVILTSRFGARTPYHHLCLNRWKKQGVDIRVSTLNVARRDEAKKLLEEAMEKGPVGGIFNSAAVLKDAFMDAQSADDFREVCNPKGTATKHLDETSRMLCPGLDLFVCFSSMSCGRGNAGQTNYGFANSMMERICEDRRRAGLHGLAIQWGIIGGVGLVHRHMGEDALISGVIAQTAKSCLATLDDFLQEDAPVVSSYLAVTVRKNSGKGNVMEQFKRVLGMSLDELNPNRSLGSMTIDSMMGVELKQLLESSCGVSLTLQEIQNLTIGDIKQMQEKADNEAGQVALITTSSLRVPAQLLNSASPVQINQMGVGNPIFILRMGDEGMEPFAQLASLMSRPVAMVMWTDDAPSDDIHLLAEFLYSQMNMAVSLDLVSCSISTNVALAIALLSQKTDKLINTLTILNGSDALMRSLNPEEDENDKDVDTLCRFLEQFGEVDTYKLREDLKKASNLDQRLKLLSQFVESSSSRPVEKAEFTAAVNNFIVKTRLFDSYVPAEKLHMDLTLVEDPTRVLPNDVTRIKECFSKVVSGNVNVHRVCGIKDLLNPDQVVKVANLICTRQYI